MVRRHGIKFALKAMLMYMGLVNAHVLVIVSSLMNSWLGYVELVIIRDTLWFGYVDACHR